jgi:hypothetical protein
VDTEPEQLLDTHLDLAKATDEALLHLASRWPREVHKEVLQEATMKIVS